MTKSELRKFYLQKRAELSEGERANASRRIADRFFEMFDLSAVKILHCFVPIGKLNEVDTSLIYRRVWNDFPRIQTAAPRLDPTLDEIQNVAFTTESELIESKWGIREPPSGETIPAGDIDIVVVPLLCFDQAGCRVGYGKGFYDKFLAKCRPDCKKVGVSYFPPETEISNVAGHDVPLNACLTPDQTYIFPGSNSPV